MSAVIEQTEQATVTTLPTAQLRPNDYNPNTMTDDEFAELVAEVRHLGRLPKPVVARPNGTGFVIVDGEHGWRAACEVGLAEVPCEVITADDFEAMRQTYKRNQHGTHNPVPLGRMFRQMMDARGLSQRALAEEINVSEGTVRNALEYAKAAEMRNGYAFEALLVKQVRCFNRLPPQIGGLWLDGGASIKALVGPKNEAAVDALGLPAWLSSEWRRIEEAGLVEYLASKPVRNAADFTKAIETLRKWDALESKDLSINKLSI